MTDQELNEAVARKLGWKPLAGCDLWNVPGSHPADGRELPDYCHSIEAAWEIFDHLIAKGGGGAVLYSEQEKHWEAALTDSPRLEGDSIEKADTAPKAICLAFLKLNGD